jgi:HSP20 family protein
MKEEKAMSILKWTPGFGSQGSWRDLDRFRRQVEGLLETLSGTVERRLLSGSGVYPLLNIGEDDDHLYVTAELPGVAAQDLDISVHGQDLIIRGERRIAEAGSQVNYHRREREAGTFRRVVGLPVKVDAEKVSASVKDGVLRLTLPKAAEVKPRQVAVAAG